MFSKNTAAAELERKSAMKGLDEILKSDFELVLRCAFDADENWKNKSFESNPKDYKFITDTLKNILDEDSRETLEKYAKKITLVSFGAIEDEIKIEDLSDEGFLPKLEKVVSSIADPSITVDRPLSHYKISKFLTKTDDYELKLTDINNDIERLQEEQSDLTTNKTKIEQQLEELEKEKPKLQTQSGFNTALYTESEQSYKNKMQALNDMLNKANDDLETIANGIQTLTQKQKRLGGKKAKLAAREKAISRIIRKTRNSKNIIKIIAKRSREGPTRKLNEASRTAIRNDLNRIFRTVCFALLVLTGVTIAATALLSISPLAASAAATAAGFGGIGPAVAAGITSIHATFASEVAVASSLTATAAMAVAVVPLGFAWVKSRLIEHKNDWAQVSDFEKNIEDITKLETRVLRALPELGNPEYEEATIGKAVDEYLGLVEKDENGGNKRPRG